jgi:glycosyltransferase involved in cell wall biosynthesis
LRIAVHTDGPSPHLFPLLEAWRDGGDELRVLLEWRVGRFGGPEVTGIDPACLAWLRDDYRGQRRSWTALRHIALLRHLLEDADVLILGSYANVTAAMLLGMARMRGLPVVLHLERPGSPAATISGRLRRSGRSIAIGVFCRVSTLVWPMSARGAKVYGRAGGTLGATVPYPLDARAWSVPTATDLAARWSRTTPLRIAVVGTLSERKRPMLALATAEHLAATGVDLELTLVGDGPLREIVAIRAASLPFPVRLLGALDGEAVREVLRTTHVLLHPAANDGWGMVVPEAAASGCVVVASSDTDAAVELAADIPTVVTVTDPTPALLAEQVTDSVRQADASRMHAAAEAVATRLSPQRLGELARKDLRTAAPDLARAR